MTRAVGAFGVKEVGKGTFMIRGKFGVQIKKSSVWGEILETAGTL